MIPTPTDILTVKELHRYLKVPTPTLYALAQNGLIPAAKIGKHWRFRRADIDEWLKVQQRTQQLAQKRLNKKPTNASHK